MYICGYIYIKVSKITPTFLLFKEIFKDYSNIFQRNIMLNYSKKLYKLPT